MGRMPLSIVFGSHLEADERVVAAEIEEMVGGDWSLVLHFPRTLGRDASFLFRLTPDAAASLRQTGALPNSGARASLPS